MMRFKFNLDKTVQAIDFVAQHKPGITQYYIGKILFFADREHVLDYGRPITGDKYVAMEHGPVPSATRDLLRVDSGYPDEMIDRFHERLRIKHQDNKQHVFSKGHDKFPALSGTDKEYLLSSLQRYGSMSFGTLREISHEDPAYADAWDRPGNANEMDVSLWLDQLDEPELAKSQLQERVGCVA
ncbi:Panacea domain-containing protein [Rhizobium anhuiense]|uniref:DUF4065 domain-containing protein n=1 Tax=Rhizobium anhuiense TaxID=1184720 RepID=A0A3S0SB16_9HYPH|nr:Panacea domain-containing protein [Rhizobium anhuiense]RUM02429.1 DUF4065 domain-containing protein [Rhizobium anhuiense]GGD78818.1 hypothetical protein GCM10008012_23210 [Rhizobium anhuiense]